MGLLDWVRRVAGPEGTANALHRAYSVRISRGRSEEEALLGMFTTRPGWMSLPRDFLTGVVEKLETYTHVSAFIMLAEEHGIRQHNIGDGYLLPELLARTFTGLGNSLAGRGRPVDAERAFLLALKLDPDWFPASSSLGMLYYFGGQYRAAVGYLQHALQLAERYRLDVAGTEWPAPDVKTLMVFRDAYHDCVTRLATGP